jgi:hypothetical protein
MIGKKTVATKIHRKDLKHDFGIQSVRNESLPSNTKQQRFAHGALSTRYPSQIVATVQCHKSNIPIRIMLFAHGKN